ncbi:hypothetical protein RSAG8_12364, partial [Rhizoctonia solani AG-8 WAC10335]
MSRKLRSGRNYDTSKAPDASKRQTRKRKSPAETKAKVVEQANGRTGEHAIVPRREQLTFGTTSGVARNHGDHVVIVGTGKRRGIALNGDAGVKLSPAAYLALTHRAPPIRRVLSWPLPTFETCETADAPIDGEATAQSSVVAAKRAPAAPSAPNTPTTTSMVEESELDREVFVTARTSRVLDESIALDKDGNAILAQYVVEDNISESPTVSSACNKRRRRKSKGKRKSIETNVSLSTESKSTANHEGLTWDEEVRRVTGGDTYAERYVDLPDVTGWVNPNLSQSDNTRTPTDSIEQRTETDTDSMQVNALIYEVDENYVFDDEEYAEVLRNIREEGRSESSRSQTRGAGPSRSHHAHHVTIEEVDEESDATATSRTRSYVGKGKAKSKSKPNSKKKGKKRKRPSLGMALEDLEGPRERLVRPREAADSSMNYRGGGYFEKLVGTTPIHEGRGSKKARLPSSEDRSSSRRDQSPLRRPPMPLRQPRTPLEPSEPLDNGSGDNRSMHTSSSEESAESSNSSDSDNTSSAETRTSALNRSVGHRADRRFEEMVRKLKKQNKKLEKKIITQARSGYKAQTPKPYRGEADIDKYDVFIFNYKLFVDDTKLSDGKAVVTMSQFLEDKATTYFMLNVALHPNRHTMEAIFIGLDEYCFPPDFKDEMCHKYNQKCQGESSIQDYFAELARLRMRLREIDNCQHILRAWDGTVQYIKIEWALKGISAKTTDIDTLHETDLDTEHTHKIK